MKLGWLTVEGPPALVAEDLDRLELVCDTYLSVGTPVQLAARTLLEESGTVREQILGRVRQNLQALRDALAAGPGAVTLLGRKVAGRPSSGLLRRRGGPGPRFAAARRGGRARDSSSIFPARPISWWALCGAVHLRDRRPADYGARALGRDFFHGCYAGSRCRCFPSPPGRAGHRRDSRRSPSRSLDIPFSPTCVERDGRGTLVVLTRHGARPVFIAPAESSAESFLDPVDPAPGGAPGAGDPIREPHPRCLRAVSH